MSDNGHAHKRLNHHVIALTMLLTTTAAHADILATGAVFGGATQTQVTCYLYNAGQLPIAILTRAIIGPTGVVPSFDNCPASLATDASCLITFTPATTQAYSCRFDVTGPEGVGNLRGVLDIRDNTNHVLINSNLR